MNPIAYTKIIGHGRLEGFKEVLDRNIRDWQTAGYIVDVQMMPVSRGNQALLLIRLPPGGAKIGLATMDDEDV